jgi:hypothetical protein
LPIETVSAVVVAGDHGGLDLLVQFHDQLVALVQQVVRHLQLVAGGQLADLVVQLGDLRGVGVDGGDAGFDLGVHALADVFQARRSSDWKRAASVSAEDSIARATARRRGRRSGSAPTRRNPAAPATGRRWCRPAGCRSG